MTTTTFADRIALARITLEWFQQHKGELAGKGLQPDYWIDNIEENLDATVRLNDLQEALKAQQKTVTKELNQSDRKLYKLVSGAVDAGISAYGVNSPEATQLSRARSRIHRPDKEEEESETQKEQNRPPLESPSK